MSKSSDAAYEQQQIEIARAEYTAEIADLAAKVARLKAIAIDLAQKAYSNEAEALNARRRIEAASSK